MWTTAGVEVRGWFSGLISLHGGIWDLNSRHQAYANTFTCHCSLSPQCVVRNQGSPEKLFANVTFILLEAACCSFPAGSFSRITLLSLKDCSY